MAQTEQQRRQQVLQDFMNHEGWDILKEELDKRIESTRKMITWESVDTAVVAQYNKVEYTYYDVLRQELSLLKDIKKRPEILTKPNQVVQDKSTI